MLWDSPIRRLQIIVLLAASVGAPLTIEAQQDSIQAPVALSQQPVTDSEPNPTPENIGDSMFVQRRYHEALDAYQKAPTPSPDVWNKMGIAYQMMFDLKDASRCYRKSLVLRSDSANVVNNLGTVYELQGNYKQAERLFRKALKLDPISARAAANLGTSLLAQGKYLEGSEIYKRALALDADVFDDSESSISSATPLRQRRAMNYYKAQAYAQDGMTDRAIRYLQKAVREGFTGLRKAAGDKSFARLHGNPIFERLVAQEGQKDRPAP